MPVCGFFEVDIPVAHLCCAVSVCKGVHGAGEMVLVVLIMVVAVPVDQQIYTK